MAGRHIAILIDAGYFLKRLPKVVPPERCTTPEQIVRSLRRLCMRHVIKLTGCDAKQWRPYLYRVFYYDARPFDGKAHHPVDNRSIDFSQSDVAAQRRAIFDTLRRERKTALRLGKVNRERDWTISPRLTKKLLRSRDLMAALASLPMTVDEVAGAATLELTEQQQRDLIQLRNIWQQLDQRSVALGLRQKGVDMRIGLDIASLALKRQVDTIVLVAGDSDFVPAAKFARREGIDFILDPLWQQVNPDLFEHIDGLQSGFDRPGTSGKTTEPQLPG